MLCVVGDVEMAGLVKTDSIANAAIGQLDKDFANATGRNPTDGPLFLEVHRKDIAIAVACWTFDPFGELARQGQRGGLPQRPAIVSRQWLRTADDDAKGDKNRQALTTKRNNLHGGCSRRVHAASEFQARQVKRFGKSDWPDYIPGAASCRMSLLRFFATAGSPPGGTQLRTLTSTETNFPLIFLRAHPMTNKEQVLLKCSRFSVHALEIHDRKGHMRTREVIRHPGAVVLLPVLDDGRVVMIENHRHSVGQTLLELPAGTIELGEPPESTAGRELIEETGYRAGRLEKLHEFFSCPGICDELMHLYLATELTAGQPDREATEQIENRIVSREEIAALIAHGEIRDAKTLVGLYALLARPTKGS
jgi:ADP-ribose pyrophosphatase